MNNRLLANRLLRIAKRLVADISPFSFFKEVEKQEKYLEDFNNKYLTIGIDPLYTKGHFVSVATNAAFLKSVSGMEEYLSAVQEGIKAAIQAENRLFDLYKTIDPKDRKDLPKHWRDRNRGMGGN